MDGTNRESTKKHAAKHEKGSFKEKESTAGRGKGGRRRACGSS